MVTAESKPISQVVFLSELHMGHAQKTYVFWTSGRLCRRADVVWGSWQVDAVLRVLEFLLQVLLVTQSIKTMGGRKDVANNGREQFWHM